MRPNFYHMDNSASWETAAVIFQTTFLCITETWNQHAYFLPKQNIQHSGWTTAPEVQACLSCRGRQGRQLGTGTTTAIPKQAAPSCDSEASQLATVISCVSAWPRTEKSPLGSEGPAYANALP